MPSIPKKQDISKNASTASMINAIANDPAVKVHGDIPHVYAEKDTIDPKISPALATLGTANKELSYQTLRDAGNTIVNYQPLANAFAHALVNRVGMVRMNVKQWTNKYSFMKKGLLEFGESTEEINVEIAKSYGFDPQGAEDKVFKRNIPDIKSAFHVLNYQQVYEHTVTTQELKTAFLSFNGVNDLVNKIIQRLYDSSEYDEFLVTKYMLAEKAVNGGMYPVNIPTLSPANSNEITTIMKTISDDITEFSPDYNEAGVHSVTYKDEQYFVMSNEFANVIDVNTLAFAFNMDKVELSGRIVRTKSFGFSAKELERLNHILSQNNPNFVPVTDAQNDSYKAIPVMLLDKEFTQIYDNLNTMQDIYNPLGLYWNYYYHQWKIFSVSPFSNAIVFTTETPAVTSVTVTPGTATGAKGNLITFNVDVEVTGYASSQVNWTMSGNSSINTTIDQQGRVYLAKDEAGPTITVTATSWIDSTKAGTATITVV